MSFAGLKVSSAEPHRVVVVDARCPLLCVGYQAKPFRAQDKREGSTDTLSAGGHKNIKFQQIHDCCSQGRTRNHSLACAIACIPVLQHITPFCWGKRFDKQIPVNRFSRCKPGNRILMCFQNAVGACFCAATRTVTLLISSLSQGASQLTIPPSRCAM